MICAGPLDQTTRTLTDALAVFEVLSDDTATTDRVVKLIDYAAVPSLRSYVLLEQTAIAATLFQRAAVAATGSPVPTPMVRWCCRVWMSRCRSPICIAA